MNWRGRKGVLEGAGSEGGLERCEELTGPVVRLKGLWVREGGDIIPCRRYDSDIATWNFESSA